MLISTKALCKCNMVMCFAQTKCTKYSGHLSSIELQLICISAKIRFYLVVTTSEGNFASDSRRSLALHTIYNQLPLFTFSRYGATLLLETCFW